MNKYGLIAVVIISLVFGGVASTAFWGPSADQLEKLKRDINMSSVKLTNQMNRIDTDTQTIAKINADISESNRKVQVLLREETEAKIRINKLMQDETVLKNLKIMEAKDNLADLISKSDAAKVALVALQGQVAGLDGKAKEMAALVKNRYVLHVQLKQSNVSLSISKHIKNAMNAEEFDIIVDKKAYDSAVEGTDMFEAFRVGSLLLKGSIGSWHLKVLSKRVMVEP